MKQWTMTCGFVLLNNILLNFTSYCSHYISIFVIILNLLYMGNFFSLQCCSIWPCEKSYSIREPACTFHLNTSKDLSCTMSSNNPAAIWEWFTFDFFLYIQTWTEERLLPPALESLLWNPRRCWGGKWKWQRYILDCCLCLSGEN